MKLQWVEFENLETGLKIERIYFNKDITLLVGLSGAGKTQVLNAVKYSLSLAVDKNTTLHPYSVGLEILIGEDNYEWFYQVNKVNPTELMIAETGNYEFLYEKLLCNGKTVFERDGRNIDIIYYKQVPQPKRDESLLFQYAEDENFKKLISGMRKIYLVDMEIEIRRGFLSKDFINYKTQISDIMKAGKKFDFKRFSRLPVPLKLYIVKKYYCDIYGLIFEAIKELFYEIDDIDIEEDPTRNMYFLSMKVYGKKLIQKDISNGMLKTIYYIVELFTMSDDSLVLIDEFENGLGVNCIDILCELMLSERNDLQLIITSHHPKIINAIDKEKWKIIERDGSVIRNRISQELGIGNSQHDAYFNLINRWEFEGKI